MHELSQRAAQAEAAARITLGDPPPVTCPPRTTNIRSESCPGSGRCVLMTRVIGNIFSTSITCASEGRSRWAVASSIDGTPLDADRALRASSTRCFWPPESTQIHVADERLEAHRHPLDFVVDPGQLCNLEDPFHFDVGIEEGDILCERAGKQLVVLADDADLPATGTRLVSGRPSIRTCPAPGSSRPMMIFSNVVLPPPDGPTSATISPASTDRLTLRRTSASPEP